MSEATPSPESEATLSPETEATPSPETEATLSPETEATPSPETQATPSPETQATPSPDTQATPSPDTQATPSPDTQATPSPDTQATPSPETQATPSPDTQATPSPDTQATPSPETQATPSPETQATPSPETQATPSPETQATPSPDTQATPSPDTQATPSPESYGRVDADGTVYVTTADGERSVGQIPDVPAEEALAFFTRRYTALETEVGLLEERIKRGALNPDEARKSISSVKSSVADAHAVGDLAGLVARLESLAPVLAEANEARKAERAKAHEETKAAKETMVAEAEKIAAGNDWRGGVNRFRTLLDEWKALPRIDRATDDDLWHRFSSARTTYTRRRKAQFAEQSAKRDGARQAKEAIVAEAREIAASTEWGAGAGAFRDLMTRWKAAGPAPRDIDDQLWAEFRGIQDDFFARRTDAATATNTEFSENLGAKLALLDAAEKDILPVRDVTVARQKYRSFLSRYNEHGRVPREQIRPLEGRVRAIEKAITEAEESEWRRTDPETRERATGTVALLSDQIAKLTAQLDKANSAKDTKKVTELTASITTYESWLEQASKTLEDFSG